MEKEVSIVLSVERKNYRKLAQEWFGLTDEQMVGMDVHHNPPRSQGGRNVPEHLFIYHYTLHAAIHENNFTEWARKGGQVGGKIGGRKNAEARTGVCDPEINRKVIETQRETGAGFFDKEAQKRRARKAGTITAQRGTGVHTPERRRKGGLSSFALGVGFHTPENRSNCKGKVWWINSEGKTLRSKEKPGPEWQRGRKWRSK